MGNWVVEGIEGRHLRDPWSDSHVLPSKQQEHGPEQIQKLRSKDKSAEGNSRRDFLGCQRDSEMADEHNRDAGTGIILEARDVWGSYLRLLGRCFTNRLFPIMEMYRCEGYGRCHR